MSSKVTKKILIAEDEKPLARALVLKLENEGFAVEVAADGLEVKKKLEENKYDLILMDIMMPHHDGFSLMADLKKEKVQTSVIVLSNLGQEEDKRRAKEAGAVEYFIKSDIQLSDVVAKIKKILKVST